MAQGGMLTARIGDGTWRFELDGFVPVAELVEHALDIRQQPSFSNLGGFARSVSVLKDAQLTMSDIQNFLMAEFAGLKLFVEGTLDVRYIQRAAQLLGKGPILDQVNIAAVGGAGTLRNLWSVLKSTTDDLVSGETLLLFDCDTGVPSETVRNAHRRSLSLQASNPVQAGIENLFDRPILNRAISHKPDFIDIVSAHRRTVRGKDHTVPESWTVNPDEKANLCDWMCEHGTANDFRDFRQVFDILEDLLP